ncbi:MAG: carbohydrate kinase [Proteobacteria bacterium]|nr:carbohydrate kinase [Pseudomonadota bacterium]
MIGRYLIGLDFGTLSVRGVLIDAESGVAVDHHASPYRHGVMTGSLADGTPLPSGFALQDARDYLIAAEEVLILLGKDRHILAIGVDFTASSPLPATADGTPLSELMPSEPHAYVKLWKHSAQHYADTINTSGGAFLDDFGGRLSGEWLLAKAAQVANEAPAAWAAAERFIEAGDWMVMQLTGHEARNLGFAAYKAQYSVHRGYPADIVPGLDARLARPLPAGSPAGELNAAWRRRTGITGPAIVAVAIIDSHAVLPAIGAVEDGTMVGALGTSAAYLFLTERRLALPVGLEGMAHDGSLPGFWLYEAGQAAFGDVLAWFVRTFPRGPDLAASFAAYNAEAAALAPGDNHLVGLDWWNGNRVPYADSRLSGLLMGLGLDTTAAGIYRALMEAICYGARQVLELATAGGLGTRRMVMTSGLAETNPLLLAIMADILGREIELPVIAHATATGAAIHGAVAAGVVADFTEGATRFGARSRRLFRPDAERSSRYQPLFSTYCELAGLAPVRAAMRCIGPLAGGGSNTLEKATEPSRSSDATPTVPKATFG